MTERTWQGLGVAAVAVGIVFGLMPILSDVLRVVALVAALGLAVAAWIVRRRVRASADREGLDAHGAGTGALDGRGTGLGGQMDEHRPDQRHIGLGSGGA